MGIILFLVDTSASMNQKTFLGTSYLDVAKGAIDTFMKYRARDPASRGDRYMLVSFDDPPNAIKTGWKENHPTFVLELKNLRATGLSTFGRSLKEAIDLLSVHRLHTGIDHYGQGRNPFYLEPAVVIAITDGGKFVRASAGPEVEDELLIPVEGSSEGSELTKEFFRWDQRLFTVLLQLPGLFPVGSAYGKVDKGNNDRRASLSDLCESTGGQWMRKCYIASNMKSLSQCMESLSQKLHPGVVLHFRKIGSEEESSGSAMDTAEEVSGSRESGTDNQECREESPPNKETTWHDTRRMIYVKPSPKNNIPTGHWPIPESFWPDGNMSVLPSRDAHPLVWFSATAMAPMLLESFAFDKYELEPSPLTQYILQQRNPGVCWQVFISDSGKEKGIRHPFGYLKASSSGNFVNLFIMPYNYPRLLPLIEELQQQQLRPSPKWRVEFADYISTIPSYYTQPVRKALQLMGAHPGLVPDTFDGQISFTISNYLRKLKKQAKMEGEKLMSRVARSRTDTTIKRSSSAVVDLGEGVSITIGGTQPEETLSSQSYRNPFDIPRGSLLSQVTRMRANFLFSSANTPNLIEEVTKHSVPIGQMGNYQEHLKKINPLREVDTGAVRTQLFGNPFKLEKSTDKRDIENLADEMMVDRMKRSGTLNKKRKIPAYIRSPSPCPPGSKTIPPPPETPSVSKTAELVAATSKQQTSKPELHRPKLGTPPPQLKMPTDKTPPASSNGPDLSTASEPMDVEMSTATIRTVSSAVTELERPPGSKNGSLPQADHVPKPVVCLASESQLTTHNATKDVPLSRKRTPSPTSVGPPPKRPALEPMIKLTNSEGRSLNNKTVVPPLATSRLTSPALSSASKVLHEEIRRKQSQDNTKLKQLIFKEIRKHSKNYDPIFQLMENIQGPLDVRKAFVLEIIKEAERFRKKHLVQALEEWMSRLGAPGQDKQRTKPKPPSIVR